MDTVEKNAEFRRLEELSYALVSDVDKQIASELGILVELGERGEVAARTTYLIDPDGTILGAWAVPVDGIDRHAEDVLEAARDLENM